MEHYFNRYRAWAIVIPAMLVLILLCTMPVSAADIDITIEGPGISNWIFTPGITNIDSANITLNVSSISSMWTVSVKDDLDYSKPPLTVGKMVEWDGTAYVTPGPCVLGTAMNIAGPSVLSKYTGASVTLDGSNQIIESGHIVVNSEKIPITIRQPIAYSDPVLRGGHLYQVIVTYIAFAEGGPAPVVTGIVPAEGIIGTTVTVTDLSGLNFLPHSVAVLNRTGSPAINLTATSNATSTRMTGTLNIPADATVGRWDVTVTNPDGRIGTKPQLFWIKYPAAPVISFFTPISGSRGDIDTYFGLSGDGFHNGVVVNLTHGASVISATVSEVTSTFVSGSITIPSNAPTGYWDLVVTNNDGQSATRPYVISIS
jgi:hypothetical protein